MLPKLGLMLALCLPIARAYPSFSTPISSGCTDHPAAAKGLHLAPKQDS
jgi:hypothetical protein